MSLQSFCVGFDRLNATYTAGEVVTGNIILRTNKIKKARGLYLYVTGKAHVHWTETKTRRNARNKVGTYQKSYTNSEKYFDTELILFGARGSDIQIEIPPGYHRYPFTINLPTNIPSSFEHKHGFVRYTVKGVIDRPWRFNHECKAAFTVLSKLDLNAHRQKCFGIEDVHTKHFRSFCYIDEGSLNVRVRVPSSGYVPGQTINTAVDFTNLSNTVLVTKINTKFEQRLKFHATSKTKVNTYTLVSSKDRGPFTVKKQTTSELLIPPIPPSYLEFCRIIDIEYILRVTVHVSGLHSAIHKTYLMTIGTVPLYYPPSAPPLNKLRDASTSELGGTTVEVPAMSMPRPVQPSAPSSENQFSNSYDFDAIHPIGFVDPNQPSTSAIDWQIPPPSYEECMSGAENIRDSDESNYVYGANDPFVPRYPVFKYPSQSVEDK